MNKYNKLQLYIVLVLSVFFQSYLNLYNTYTEHKERESYSQQLAAIEKTKNNANSYKTDIKTRENPFIPKQAQFVGWFLRESAIDSFRLSSSIAGGSFSYAFVEEAYPIQVSSKSHYLIATSHDDLPKDCNLLDSQDGTQIVYCP